MWEWPGKVRDELRYNNNCENEHIINPKRGSLKLHTSALDLENIIRNSLMVELFAIIVAHLFTPA